MKLHHSLHSHLKQHHKKYLGGLFGGFAVVKMVIVLAGLLGLANLASTFAMPERKPIGQASNVVITGTLSVGQTLTGEYNYTDPSRRDLVGSGGFGYQPLGEGSSTGQNFTSVAVDDEGTPYVVYTDGMNENKATLMKYNGTSWEIVGGSAFSSGFAGGTLLKIYNTTPYVAYGELINGNAVVTVKKYNGTDRETVGEQGFSYQPLVDTIGASALSFAINNEGIPYVAYNDTTNNYRATVKKFIGADREIVGNEGFTYQPAASQSGSARELSLQIDSEDVPYLAYRDANNKATVMKFNGSSWEFIGEQGFSSGTISYPSLAIDNDGTPYLAYRQYRTGFYQMNVMKFNGSSWEIVGSGSITNGVLINYLSLTVDSDGIPYVAYNNSSSTYGVVVKKYTSGIWTTIGDASQNRTRADIHSPQYISLTMSSQDVPYIAYADGNSGYKATVRKYIADAEGASAYQRYRDGNAIEGATGKTYKVTASDAGTTLLFQVTPLSQLGYQGSGVVSSGATIAALPIEATDVTITGTGNVGETLVGSYNYLVHDWLPLSTDTLSSGRTDSIFLAIDNTGTQYVAYRNCNNNCGAVVKKNNGATWETVGSGLESFAGNAGYLSFALASDGTPYVAYGDQVYGYRSVMKYDGSSWVYVGTPGFSASSMQYLSLKLSADGTPYVVYSDGYYGYQATVMKYDSGTDSWITIGTPGFSAGQIGDPSLVISSTGSFYLAYPDSAKNWAATIMTHNSGSVSREEMNTEGLSTAMAFPKMAIYNDIPYIVYQDQNNEYKATVMMYNGSSREAIGSQWFSTAYPDGLLLTISSDGIPYVTYNDNDNQYKATVMKYDGNDWINVGSDISAGNASSPTLALYDGTPYIAYADELDNTKATVMRYTPDSDNNEGATKLQRQSDGEAIDGATSSTYKVLTGDQGKNITFEVTPVSVGQVEGAPVSTQDLLINSFPVVSGVTISGYPLIGTQLQGSYIYSDIDGGWDVVGNEGFSYQPKGDYVGGAEYTSLVISSGTAYVAYRSMESCSANVMKLTGDEWQYIGNSDFSAGCAYDLSFAMSDATPYIVYTDENYSYALTVMKYNSGTNEWEVVGTPGFSVSSVRNAKISVYNDTPYVVYTDQENNYGATVMKYNSGTNEREVVGTPSFSAGEAQDSVIAMYNNTPYVAYADYGNGGKATVMKYNSGTNEWEVVGTPGFSSGYQLSTAPIGPREISLTISDGIPYVAYVDEANNSRATVMKYTSGTNTWSVVGQLGFSGGPICDINSYSSLGAEKGNAILEVNASCGISAPSLAVTNGIPYVAYVDNNNAHKATAMKYNSDTNEWELVGSAGFSGGPATCLNYSSDALSGGKNNYLLEKTENNILADAPTCGIQYPSLAIDSDGNPYIAYSDGLLNRNATVRKFTTDYENNTTYKWYRDNVIISTKGTTYTITGADLNKTISFEVTPSAIRGSNPGIAVRSSGLLIIDAIIIPNQDNEKDSVTVPGGTGKVTHSGTWDGTISAPETVKPSSTGEATLVKLGLPATTTIINTRKVGSDTAELFPEEGRLFTVNIEVGDEYNTMTLNVYRSTDGSTWTGNTPEPNCTVTGGICSFLTDHLSFFAPVLPASETQQQPSGGGGGGASTNQCTATRDCKNTYLNQLCGPCTEVEKLAEIKTKQASVFCYAYTPELNKAYAFAFANSITTIADCEKANLQGTLLRSHMAKMMSNFAINTLGIKPNTGTICNFIDMNKESDEMKFYANLACQLGLMGLNDQGTANETFNPNETVTRAQFGTVLSRLIRQDQNNGGTPYYAKHLQALKDVGIMTKIDTPSAKELRGFVMLMLQRVTSQVSPAENGGKTLRELVKEFFSRK